MTIDKPMYIEGPISSIKEDVEGNLYDPNDFDTSKFLTEGFLDIDHLMHDGKIPEAVIGRPVSIWKAGGQLFARFLLNNTPFCREIHEYVKTHPGVLGFSVAGWVNKVLFERGGRWELLSCALTHAPKQPDVYAVALSANGMTLRSVMSAFSGDLLHGTVNVQTVESLYHYFRPMVESPVLAVQLSAWAHKRIIGDEIWTPQSMAATDVISQMRQNLFLRDEDVNSFVLDTKAKLAHWKLIHPDDEHLSSDGRFNSLEDAIYHLRYCLRLNPIQVATILGRLRGRDDVIRNISKTHGAA